MTICIAIACVDEEKSAIVLCADRKASFYDGFTSSEGGSKFLIPAEGWCALLSGPLEYAKRLAWQCGEYLKNNKVSHVSVHRQLIEPFREFRRVLMEEEAAKHGVSYTDFVSGRIQEKNLLKELQSAFRAISREYSLIVTGIVEGSPLIVKIENDLISSNSCFAVIGSGCFLASVPLCERNIGSSRVPIENAMYLAYEAKRFSEKDPHVSKSTLMCVQYEKDREPDHNGLLWLPRSTMERLQHLYGRFGLHPVMNIPPRSELLG